MSKSRCSGSSDTSVVSAVPVAAPGPPVTKLPIETWRRLTRPANGAVIRVKSRLSCAAWIAALACSIAACAASWACTRWSSSSRDAKLSRTSAVLRATCRFARSSPALAAWYCAPACCSAMSYGRGSMTNSRSPLRTICPSVKWISLR